MLKVSEEFNKAFKSDLRQILVRLTIGAKVYENKDLTSVSYDGGSISGNTFAIGSTVMNSIKVTFCNLVEGLKELDEVKLEIGITLPTGTVEYVPMGIFIIDGKINMDRNENRTSIECQDRMCMLEAGYKSKIKYPAEIRAVALEIANMAGIKVNESSFARLSKETIVEPVGYTYRQALGLIAQFQIGFVRFDRAGLLDIRGLEDPEYTIATDEYFLKGLTKNEVFYRLGGISCKTGDKEENNIQSGSTSGAQIVLENKVMTKPILDAIYEQLKNINYYPFDLSWRGNPAIEAGDWLKLEDKQGNIFKTPNLSYSLEFKGGLTAKSSASTDVQSTTTYAYKGNINQQIQWIQDQVIDGMGNNVSTGIDEPLLPKEGDIWFKKVGPDTEIWVYENEQWVFKTTTAADPKILEAIEEAQKDIDKAKADIQSAVDKANMANETAGFSNKTSAEAKAEAIKAGAEALSAGKKAEMALDNFNNMNLGSRNYLLNASLNDGLNHWRNWRTDTAGSKRELVDIVDFPNVQKAMHIVSTVAGQFGYAQDSTIVLPNTEYTASYFYKTKSKTQIAVQVGNGVNDTFKSHPILTDGSDTWQRITFTFTTDKTAVKTGFYSGFFNQGFGDILITGMQLETGNKVTDFKPNPEDLAISITNINGELKQKVSQTTFDTLKGTVNTQGTLITQNKNLIEQKANQTDVNTLTGRVSSAEGKLIIQAGQIAQTVSKTELSGKGYATQTWTQGQIKTTADNITAKVSKVATDVAKVQTEYSSLEIKVNGIQTTVAGKADQSQVTQLANQWSVTTSTLGQKNLVVNSEFDNGQLTDWVNSISWYTSDYPSSMHNGSYGAGIFITADNNYHTLRSKFIKSRIGIQFSFSVYSKIYSADASSLFFITFEEYDASGKRVATKDIYSDMKQRGTWQYLKFENYKVVNTTTIQVRIALTSRGAIHAIFSQPMIVKSDVIGSYVQDIASSSELLVAQNDINLRVQKGDVLNQINISPEGILIDGKKIHITGQTSIDNAVIKDAMIANIKADKITAGTINAANVDLINLNASNITAGVINGANLSINLGNGQVVFQKGRIHSASNNVDINIDKGYLSVADNDTRVMIKNGGIQFVQPNIFDIDSNPYLNINNSGGAQGFNGASIVGRDFLSLANKGDNTGMFANPMGVETFAGISFGNALGWRPTKVGGANRGIILSGGKRMSSGLNGGDLFGSSPNIKIGITSNGGYYGNRIAINGEYVHIQAVYDKTASGSSNVIVSGDGALVRSTSATKYKTDIIRTNKSDYGDKLMGLPTATWMDLADMDRYEEDPVNQPEPTRNFGMIAEDLADVGLEMLVVRGLDGELEGINYDRIGPALIPVIAKLKEEIKKLKEKMEEQIA